MSHIKSKLKAYTKKCKIQADSARVNCGLCTVVNNAQHCNNAHNY